MSEGESSERERAQLNVALERAGEELGLQVYYRDCVRPLLRMPKTQWPRCCGRGCEPCADTLKAVAERTEALLREPV